MINDGVPQQTKEWYLNQSLNVCLECLIFFEMFEVASVLKEINEKRPKIYVTKEWPEEALIVSDNKTIDIMVYVNGLIANLGCELIVE